MEKHSVHSEETSCKRLGEAALKWFWSFVMQLHEEDRAEFQDPMLFMVGIKHELLARRLHVFCLQLFSNAHTKLLDQALALSLGDCEKSHIILILTRRFCNLAPLTHLGKLLLYLSFFTVGQKASQGEGT